MNIIERTGCFELICLYMRFLPLKCIGTDGVEITITEIIKTGLRGLNMVN